MLVHVNEDNTRYVPAEVHIWTARLPSAPSQEIATTLSPEECARACRFHRAADRFRYVFAHAVLRDVLSRYLDCPPGDVRFATNPFGKPFLDETNGGRVLEFNLSHAGGLVLVGVCETRRVGIDVEEIRPMDDLSSIAESHYTPRECAFIFGQAPEDQTRAFLRCWTRKEACVKAWGKGLSIRLNSFETNMEPEPRRSSHNLLRLVDGTNWQLADLDMPEGYTAAVTVETGIDRLFYFEWRRDVTQTDGQRMTCTPSKVWVLGSRATDATGKVTLGGAQPELDASGFAGHTTMFSSLAPGNMGSGNDRSPKRSVRR